MAGSLRKPGLVTLTIIGEEQPRTFRVTSGPWIYAQQLCWVPEGETETVYSPLENVFTYQKHNDW